MKNTPTQKQKPTHECRIGLIKAAIWANQTETGIRFNVTFSRLYLDGESGWKSTDSFGRDDLLLLGKVANQAHSWIFEEMQEKEEGAPKTRS